jgi:two-component system chemotaxis response regulator CheY
MGAGNQQWKIDGILKYSYASPSALPPLRAPWERTGDSASSHPMPTSAKCFPMAPGPRLEDFVILVVEDDNFTRSLILSILRGLGVRTALEAADAGSALEQLTDGEVDVIVSDIEMHPVNGLELLRHLRTGSRPAGVVPPRAPPSQIPVIFLTAHAKAKLVEQARAAGVSAFLTKPIRPALLRDRIMSVAAQVRRNGSNPGAAEAGADVDGKPQEGAAGQLAGRQ